MSEEIFNITIRINETGMHVCDATTVRQEFRPGELYYNEPLESVPIELTREESSMIYRFRLRHPSQTINATATRQNPNQIGADETHRTLYPMGDIDE